jgi:uncharacterized protein YdiU (UPF0061 family)
MSKFKMRNRPKKPSEPSRVTFEVGDWVSVGYMLECIEKFQAENPGSTTREMMVETEQRDYHEMVIVLTAPAQSQQDYEADLQSYKIDHKAYKAWQEKHKVEIAKAKVVAKEKRAQTKLETTRARLLAELEKVENKLS